MARKKSRGSKKSSARKSGAETASAEKTSADAPETGGSTAAADVDGPEVTTPPKKPRGKSPKKAASKEKAAPGKKPARKKAPKKKAAARKPTKTEDSAEKATEETPAGEKDSGAEPSAGETATHERPAAPRGKPGKRRKKGKKKAVPSDAPSPPASVPDDDSGIALDDEDDDGLTVEDLVAATVALEEEVEAIPIDVEEDDDDVRARLIAETLALVTQDAADASASILDLADALRLADAPDDVSGEADAAPEGGADAEAEGGTDVAAEEAPDANTVAPPRITPQALLALSEIHAEGLATLPRELILDLGEASTPQERDRLLAAALAHAEMQEAIYRVPLGGTRVQRIKFGVAALVALLALAVAVRPPALLVPTLPAPVTSPDLDRGVRVALLLQAQQIEAHRTRTGSLPRSLDEVPVRLPGVRFVRSGARSYQLVAYTEQGEPIVFDSAAPGPEFEDLTGPWSSRTVAS